MTYITEGNASVLVIFQFTLVKVLMQSKQSCILLYKKESMGAGKDLAVYGLYGVT